METAVGATTLSKLLLAYLSSSCNANFVIIEDSYHPKKDVQARIQSIIARLPELVF